MSFSKISSAGAAILLSLGLIGTGAQADDSCQQFVGSYLLTVTNSDGTFASRQVLNLNSDGNVVIIDSNQGGVPGTYPPFSSEQGSWSCQRNLANATVIDFNLPPAPPAGEGLARADYQIGIGFNSISGSIVLRTFPLTADPLAHPLPTPIGTYNFRGILVK